MWKYTFTEAINIDKNITSLQECIDQEYEFSGENLSYFLDT